MSSIVASFIVLVVFMTQSAMCSPGSIPLEWKAQISQGNMLFAAEEPSQYLMATGTLKTYFGFFNFELNLYFDISLTTQISSSSSRTLL